MPDSTLQAKADLVYDTLGQEAYFGAHRAEQSDYRRSAFDDLIDKCHEGTKVGNSYLQSFLKHRVEEYPFAEFVYDLPDRRRVPTLREHHIEYQEADSPLPIWRPPIMINCKYHHDLSDEECSYLLELCRSAE